MPATEAWLDALGVRWSFEPTVAISRVDQAQSLANQARLDPLDVDVVERYTADLAAGDVFPAILLHRDGTRVGAGSLVVLGGLHRLHAHLAAGRQAIAGYVITTTDRATVLRVTYEDNRRHGLPLPSEERTAHALRLVDGEGWTARDAARCVGIPESRLSIERAARAATARAQGLDDLDGPAFAALPRAVRYQLGRCVDDVVFTEAATLTLGARLTTAETTRLVDRITSCATIREALVLIGSELEENRARLDRGHAPRKPAVRSQLVGHLSALRTLDLDQVVDGVRPDTAATLTSSIDDTIAHLEAIRGALAR